MQIIFAAVDVPAKFFALGMLSYLGRRVSQVSCLFLSAVIIFANIFVPTGTGSLLASDLILIAVLLPIHIFILDLLLFLFFYLNFISDPNLGPYIDS